MNYPLIDDPSHLERHADWNHLAAMLFAVVVIAILAFFLENHANDPMDRRVMRQLRRIFIVIVCGIALGYGITLALNNFRVPSYLQIRGGK